MRFRDLSLIPHTKQYGAVGRLGTYSVFYDSKHPDLKWTATVLAHDKQDGPFISLGDYLETKEVAIAVAEKHEGTLQ